MNGGWVSVDQIDRKLNLNWKARTAAYAGLMRPGLIQYKPGDARFIKRVTAEEIAANGIKL